MADSPLAPSAIELNWPSAADSISVSVLLEGDADSVAGRADRMLALLSDSALADVEPAVDAFRVHRVPVGSGERPSGASTQLRIAFWAGQLETVLLVIREAGAENGVDPAISGSAAAGVLDVQIAGQALPDAVAAFVDQVRAGLVSECAVAGGPPSVASVVIVSAPPEVRDAVDVWGPVPSLALMRAVKDRFDPEHRMAPGRFAGGI